MATPKFLTVEKMIALRNELKLTQDEFADRLGVARTNLCAVERKKRPFGGCMKARLALLAISIAHEGHTSKTALYITALAKEALDG